MTSLGAESARWSDRLAKRLGIPGELIPDNYGDHEHYKTLEGRSTARKIRAKTWSGEASE